MPRPPSALLMFDSEVEFTGVLNQSSLCCPSVEFESPLASCAKAPFGCMVSEVLVVSESAMSRVPKRAALLRRSKGVEKREYRERELEIRDSTGDGLRIKR